MNKKLLLLLPAICIVLCISAQTTINFRDFPLTRLVFANGLDVCGYYDSLNNILYDCYGKISLDKPVVNILEKIPHSLCCSSKDTDGDGVNDDEDKCINERGPASNFGCPVIISDPVVRIVLKKKIIFFKDQSLKFSKTSLNILDMLVSILNDYPNYKVKLTGYTDNMGNQDLNMRLSLARAEAGKSYLLSAGIDESRIKCESYGAEYPIETNKTKAGRAKNRRVEITIIQD